MAKVNVKLDYDELNKLKEQIEKFGKPDQIDVFLTSCAKELAARLLAKVIKRTPVGKKPEIKGDKFVTAEGSSGKEKNFLSAEAARIEQYWSGYTGATLRRGWTAKTHEEAEHGSGNGKNPTEYANSLQINKVGNDYVIEIINPVKYASYVEYGHRQRPGRFVPALGKRLKQGWVEGQFMLTISENEIRNSAPGILEKKLKTYLKECFN